jgi:hypothetical protein
MEYETESLLQKISVKNKIISCFDARDYNIQTTEIIQMYAGCQISWLQGRHPSAESVY